jgi:hypothetical protein
MEEKADYTVAAQYDPDADPRPLISVKIDAADRAYLLDDIGVDDEPAAFMETLSTKCGFRFLKINRCFFTPADPRTTGQQVIITSKVPMAFNAVKLPHYLRRNFRLHIADAPLETGEILLPATLTKQQIWEHLQTLHVIPDISQLGLPDSQIDITKLDKWPSGEIVAIPHTFPVTWEIEDPTGGSKTVVQETMRQLINVAEAWKLLYNEYPSLFQDLTFNYRGKLRPGQTIRAEIIRREVEVAVRLQAKNKGTITFSHERVPNLTPWKAAHANFPLVDNRGFRMIVIFQKKPVHIMRQTFRIQQGRIEAQEEESALVDKSSLQLSSRLRQLIRQEEARL